MKLNIPDNKNLNSENKEQTILDTKFINLKKMSFGTEKKFDKTTYRKKDYYLFFYGIINLIFYCKQ